MDSNNKRFTIHDTTFGNTGIQLEYNGGTPRAFIGKSNGGFIKFNSADASSQLQISSSGFILGQSGSGDTTGAFISGSKEGKLEISSSKFHLKPTGDIIVRKIDATDGTIGGFTIGDTGITSDGTSNTKIVLRGADDGGSTADVISMSSFTASIVIHLYESTSSLLILGFSLQKPIITWSNSCSVNPLSKGAL